MRVCPLCGESVGSPALREESAVQASNPEPPDATLVNLPPPASASLEQTLRTELPAKVEITHDATMMLSAAAPRVNTQDDTLAVPITNLPPSQLNSPPSPQPKQSATHDDTLVGQLDSLPLSRSTPGPGEPGASATGGASELAAGPSSLASRPSPSPGGIPSIEGYEIQSVLGRGGMGIVFKARQIGLDRVVALKMVLLGAYSSSKDVERFQSEAQAVAQFKHPNILQIYEVGSRNGQPFFSLEFMEGGTLQEKLERAPMTAQDAAGMIEVLARAVQYAHQKGILHRDIKPANVLLSADGTPKIADFGLAKRLDRNESLNASDAVVGTPTYMAPEQALGKADIGPPADIYSLGATLYEMLVGRPPFRGATVLDTLQQVQQAEPVPLRVLQPTVPADLQTICLKCLRKDPKQRYASAGELADDLRAFIENRPIAARPVPAWEKAWKWSRRNPAAASLIGVTAVSLLGFAIGGVAFALTERERAREETELREDVAKERDYAREQEKLAKQREAEQIELRKEVAKERDIATTRGKIALDNFKQAQQAVEVLIRLARDRMTNERHLETVGRELMEKAVAFYDRFLAQAPDDPIMRAQIARAHWFAGDLREKLGRYEEADKGYARAIALFQDLAKEGSVEARRDLAGVYINRSTVLQVLNKDAEADEAFDQASKLLETTSGETRDLVVEWMIGAGLNNRAIALQQRRDAQGAEDSYLRSIRAFDRLVEAFPDEASLKLEQAKTRTNLALHWTQPAPGQLARAEAMYQRSLEILNTLIEKSQAPANRKELGRTYLNRAILYMNNERWSEADKDARAAIDAFDRLAREFPAVTDYRHLGATAQLNFGELNTKRKDAPAALLAFQKSCALLQELVDDEPEIIAYRRDWAVALGTLARAQDRQLRKHAAEKVADADLNAEAKGVERAWDQTLEQWHVLRTKGGANFKNAAEWASALQNALAFHVYQAERLRKQSPDKAEDHLRRRVALQREALELAPEQQSLKSLVADGLLTLGLFQAETQKHAAAAKTIDELTKTVAPGWERYYLGGVCLALCIPAAERTLTGPERDRVVKDYGTRAIAILRDSMGAGWSDAAFLKNQPALAPLRDHPEFRAAYAKLIQSLDEKK